MTSQYFDPSYFFEDQKFKFPRVHSGPFCKGFRTSDPQRSSTKMGVHLCNSALMWNLQLVWCRGCLAWICCMVVRSLETNERGSGISSTESKNCPEIRTVVPYTSSAGSISGPLWHRYVCREDPWGRPLFTVWRWRHEAGLELAVETFNKSIVWMKKAAQIP